MVPGGYNPAGNYWSQKLLQCHWRLSSVFIANFEHISHFALVFLILTLSREMPAGKFRWFALVKYSPKAVTIITKKSVKKNWISSFRSNTSSPTRLKGPYIGFLTPSAASDISVLLSACKETTMKRKNGTWRVGQTIPRLTQTYSDFQYVLLGSANNLMYLKVTQKIGFWTFLKIYPLRNLRLTEIKHLQTPAMRSQYFEIFWCFTKFSFYHKGNEALLLVINKTYTSSLTSCQTI